MTMQCLCDNATFQPVQLCWLSQTAGAAVLSGESAAASSQTMQSEPNKTKQGPRDWLCQTAGAAAPSGGRKRHEVRGRGGK